MKINKLIIICLIIVLLTMTAVNASQEDNITVSENIVNNMTQLEEIESETMDDFILFE